MRPLFITCEGGEGAGKTTLMKRLELALQKEGHSVLCTREPGGSLLGEEIRHMLLHRHEEMPISPRAELLLFLAARAQHIEEKIKPALKEGKIVLCDRFNDSTVAYQGYARGLGVDYVQQLCDLVSHDCQPDLTLFLDIPPEIGLQRTLRAQKEATRVDRIESEKMAFHQRVREGMQELARRYPQRIITLNALQPLEQVFQEALSLIRTKDLKD